MKYALTLSLVFFCTAAFPQTVNVNSQDSICGYKIQRDRDNKLLSWYKPSIAGEGYSQVAKLASEFIKNKVPIDPKTGLKLYFISCCFDGPHLAGEEKFRQGRSWGDWPNNPASDFAGMVQSLAVDYRIFSGDNEYLGVVKEMLDYQLSNGMTPPDWPWGNVPYASADAGSKIFQGSSKWAAKGMIGDGLDGIEPDKIGELGYAFLLFYEITENQIYLNAAVHCADALSTHVVNVSANASSFAATQVATSPWPFRVNARTGVTIDDYCSNVIEPIRLMEELIRIESKIKLEGQKLTAYKHTREIAWTWLFSKNGPMKSYVWNSYFEDIPNDSSQANRVQITPLETARYLIKNPVSDPNLRNDIPALLHWVAGTFGDPDKPGIKEQTWCYEPMGSHTARYASVCALWYEQTGDLKFKEEAFRNFNFATYMTDASGVVRVGPTWPGSWFSDGYGDYIKHFIEGMAAVPEWAPAGEDHLLRSSSVIQKINYAPKEILFTTFDSNSTEVLRLAAKPKNVFAGDLALSERSSLTDDSWTWKNLVNGGVLRIHHVRGNTVKIVR